jgi:hypothetical protein
MPRKATRAVLAVAAFLAAVAAPPSYAAPPGNPCVLLTQGQVSAALGVAVDAPTRTSTIMSACTWVQSGVSIAGGKSLQVILRTAADHDQDKALMQQMSAMPPRGVNKRTTTVTSVGGLGDDAFYTTMTPGPRTTLSVKKGNVAFNVAVQSSQIPVEQQSAIEKALAQQILAGL